MWARPVRCEKLTQLPGKGDADLGGERNRWFPVPQFIPPCEFSSASFPPTGPEWVYELFLDGCRLQIHISGATVLLCTIRGYDWGWRFPGIQRAARQLGASAAILEGTATILDERGIPALWRLRSALSWGRVAEEATFFAFDLLSLNGHDLRPLPLQQRRNMLAILVSRSQATIRLSEEIDAPGSDILRAADRLGLRGIVAKKRFAPYRSGNSGDWLAITCLQTAYFPIIGYQPSADKRRGIGALGLAAIKTRQLVYVGTVDRGFLEHSAGALRKKMDALTVPLPFIDMTGRQQLWRWVRPWLVARVSFRGWTKKGELRHACCLDVRKLRDLKVNVFEIE